MKRVSCTLIATFFAACSLWLPRTLRAEPHEAGPGATPEYAAQLTYVRGVGAEQCPDEAALRGAVARRLGQDPFAAARGQRFRIEVSVASGRILGHIALVDDTGKPAGVREFEGSRDCGEVVTALALAVSLAINPNLVVTDEPEPLAPASNSVEPPNAQARLAPAPSSVQAPANADSGQTERAREKAGPAGFGRLSIGGFALGAVGIGPSANFGGSLAVRLRVIDALTVTLEGRADTPATGNLESGGSVKTQLYAGVLAPCWHVRFAAGCAVALLGSYHAESRGLNESGSDSALYSALGGRLAAEYPLSSRFSVQIRAELLSTLTPPTLLRNGQTPVWSAPAVSGGLGLGVFGQIL